MAKRFTPVIGLAVVVALAMVAVFGAMSLTNPAFAAVGAPADAELAERTVSPQVTSVSVNTSEIKSFDLLALTGYSASQIKSVGASPTIGGDAVSVAAIVTTLNSVTLTVTAAGTAGSSVLRIVFTKPDDTMENYDLTVNVIAPDDPEITRTIGTQEVPAGGTKVLNMTQYFSGDLSMIALVAGDDNIVSAARGKLLIYQR